MEPFFDKNVLSTIDSQDGDDRGDESDGFTGWFTPKLYIEGSPPENFYDPEDYESDPGTLPARDSFKDPYPEPDPPAPAEGKQEDAETQTNKKVKPPKNVTDKDVVDDSKPSGSSKSPAPGKQEQAESQTKGKVEPSREGNNKDVADDSKQSGSWGLPTLFKGKSGAEDDGPSTSKQSKPAPRSQSKGPAEIEPYPLLPSTSDPRSSKRSPSPPLLIFRPFRLLLLRPLFLQFLRLPLCRPFPILRVLLPSRLHLENRRTKGILSLMTIITFES